MKYLINLLSIVLLVTLVGCSGGESNKTKSKSGETSSNTAKMAKQKTTTQKVHVYGIDKMKYVVKKKSKALETSDKVTVKGKTYYLLKGISTKAGKQLKVTLTNISKLSSAAAMSHNWLLLKPKADPSAFARASIQAKENDYVAPEKMNFVIKETGLVAPGKSVTITFTTPEKAGDYEYICTFPGHFAAGMRGTLHVK